MPIDEYQNWRDNGCHLHPHCLSCPEPQCIHELPGGKATRRMNTRAVRIQVLAAQGKDNDQLAKLLKVSIRTIQRALSCKGNGQSCSSVSREEVKR